MFLVIALVESSSTAVPFKTILAFIPTDIGFVDCAKLEQENKRTKTNSINNLEIFFIILYTPSFLIN